MIIRFIRKANFSVLVKTATYEFKGVLYVVPEGFHFNGADIPWIFWSVLKLHPYHPSVIRAALFHDWLYKIGNKSLGDMIFKHILKEDGCNGIQRTVLWYAVKLFGGRYVK